MPGPTISQDDNWTFGGNKEDQVDFQTGFSGREPQPRRNESDDWFYPNTREGGSGTVRMKRSSGTNGFLTPQGNRVFIERRDGDRWRPVRSEEEAQELLQSLQPAGSERQNSTRQDRGNGDRMIAGQSGRRQEFIDRFGDQGSSYFREYLNRFGQSEQAAQEYLDRLTGHGGQ